MDDKLFPKEELQAKRIEEVEACVVAHNSLNTRICRYIWLRVEGDFFTWPSCWGFGFLGFRTFSWSILSSWSCLWLWIIDGRIKKINVMSYGARRVLSLAVVVGHVNVFIVGLKLYLCRYPPTVSPPPWLWIDVCAVCVWMCVWANHFDWAARKRAITFITPTSPGYFLRWGTEVDWSFCYTSQFGELLFWLHCASISHFSSYLT